MTRWKELPAGLDDAERQLVAQLRRLKDRAGLSLAALAAKTSYSSSSWERCKMNQRLIFWSKYTRISVRNTPNAFVPRLIAGPRPNTWFAESTDGSAGTPETV